MFPDKEENGKFKKKIILSSAFRVTNKNVIDSGGYTTRRPHLSMNDGSQKLLLAGSSTEQYLIFQRLFTAYRTARRNLMSLVTTSLPSNLEETTTQEIDE